MRVPVLARISHRLTVEARDRRAITSLRLLAVLDVLSNTPPLVKQRAPRTDAPLTHFASPRGKKCGLATILLLSACGGPLPQPEITGVPENPEPVVVTRWTEKTELFLEYPPLQVGEASRFAVHLTDMSSFQPLKEGRVEVYLDYGGGVSERFAVDGPSRPGIFGVDVIPTRPGTAALTIQVQSPGVDDSHDLGAALVSAEQEDMHALQSAQHEGPPGGDISFLKEQQWTLDFATQLVKLKPMRESLVVPATIEPRSGGRMMVAAPVSGRLLPSVRLPTPGAFVSAGENLGSIVPLWDGPPNRSALQLPLDEARVALDSATREQQRVERLLAVGAIPARRLQDAEAQMAVAMARHKAAQERMAYYEATRRDDPHRESQSAFSIRSHLAGVVTAVSVTNGAHVEEGDTLLEVAVTDTVHVSGSLPESRSAVLQRLKGAEIQIPESDISFPVGRLVSTARVVDPATRTLKATYLLDNRRPQLAIGQSTFLRLFISDLVEEPTVPRSALVDDSGRTLVYVQTGGESFEGRPVTLGNRQGAEVQITAGLRPGERVVTQGAYLVRLASMSSQAPAHGHAH